MLQNEIPFEQLQDGQVVWACAYSKNRKTNSNNLLCKPTKGIIHKRQRMWQSVFIPMKKDGITPRETGQVSYNARRYFNTEEDAIFGYNQLIDNSILKLETRILDMENDKI